MLQYFDNIVKKYRISGGKILHIGAHKCEERLDYRKHGWDDSKVIWIEGNPEIYTEMKKNPDICMHYGLVSDKDGDLVRFSVTNNTQYSSMLEFDQYAKEYPWIFQTRHIDIPTTTIATIIKNQKIDPEDIILTVLNIQGAELLALKGMGEFLSKIKYLYIRVSEKKMFKGGCLVDDIDKYLETFGFARMDTFINDHGWGDALYINENPKVTPVFRGGLGRRLFILAATMGYIHRNPIYGIVISSSKIEPFYIPQQSVEMAYFTRDIPIVKDIPIDRIVLEANGCDKSFRDLNEGGPAKGNLLLDGYFQNEKYFEGVESWVESQFKCPPSVEEFLLRKYPKLIQGVFLHIRRTDTVRLPYPDLTKYYDMCASTFPDDTIFFICSDDLEWCRSNLSHKNMIFIEEDPVITLWIMSLCGKGGIVSISTYSWWGGWLNRQRNPFSVIFAPQSQFSASSKQFHMISV